MATSLHIEPLADRVPFVAILDYQLFITLFLRTNHSNPTSMQLFRVGSQEFRILDFRIILTNVAKCSMMALLK